MLQKPVYVTSQGLVQLEEELEMLRSVKLPETVQRLQEAKEGGDWMDSAEFVLVEEELAFINGRIQELEHMIGEAQLIEPGNEDNIVDLGETVMVQANGEEIEKYTIVGVAETNPSQGFISNESPLGHALLDRKVGEEVIVQTPSGEMRYRILSISRSRS